MPEKTSVQTEFPVTAESAHIRSVAVAGFPGGIRLCLSGEWRRGSAAAAIRRSLEELDGLEAGRVVAFESAELHGWDSTLVAFVVRVKKICGDRKLEFDASGLPEGAARLAALAMAVPEREGATRRGNRASLAATVGDGIVRWGNEARDILQFTGEVALAFGRLVAGRARMPWRDVAAVIEETGPAAFPIVTLIAALMGIILAFVGAVQLRMFGAEIYVADLVGIGILRELGAVMTGIVMAGRTGASYAARIGTMQVNEEIDAFRTMGIPPVDFLVLPRIIGLVLMMPLLCLYADVVGILGGMLVGVAMLDLSPILYFQQTRSALGLNHLAVGLAMSVVFGALVAFFGCLRGLRCGRSASSVGEATTSAVVSGIVSIVIATAVMTVVADILGL